MKYKRIVFALIILILACTVQSAFAEDASVNGYNITVPDNYTIAQKTSNMIAMGDNDHTTYITLFFGTVQNADNVKNSLISDGEQYLDNKTYEVNGYNVTQMNFKDSSGNFHYIYLCQRGNETIGINVLCKHECPQLGDNANPATSILSSIKH